MVHLPSTFTKTTMFIGLSSITKTVLRVMWTDTALIIPMLTGSEDLYSQTQNTLSKFPTLEGCRSRSGLQSPDVRSALPFALPSPKPNFDSLDLLNS